MASGFVQTNGRVIAGEGDPAGGDALVTNLSLFPINSLYINNNTGKLWVRNEENSVVGDWVGASGGSGSSFLPETGTGTATGNIIGSLAGFTLNIQQGSNPFLTIDPTTNAEQANLQARNITGGGNNAGLQTSTSDTNSLASLSAGFDSPNELATIEITAASGSTAITHTADAHTFNVGSSGFLQVTNGVRPELDISGDGSGSILRSFNNTDDGNQSILDLNTNNTEANFDLSVDFNDGVKTATIEGNADATTSTITHTADQHIFNVSEFADNAAAITGGLATGAIYRTADALKIVH